MRVAGTILAGGRSTRMGCDKPLVALHGRPLVAHVMDRFAPQVGVLALSANGDAARFAPFGLAVLPDAVGGYPGPLAGISAALAFAQAQDCTFAAIVPADAPFLPLDLVARLMAGLDHAQVACARSSAGIEPLFSLWHIGAGPAVAHALAQGEGSPRALLHQLRHATITFDRPGEARGFANLNTRAELARAESETDG